MVQRLRRSRKASCVILVIALGLVSSAPFAYPLGDGNSEVKAKGTLGPPTCTQPSKGKPKCGKLSAHVRRPFTGSHAGSILGRYVVKDALGNTTYKFNRYVAFSCPDSSSATFRGISGTASGTPNRGKTFTTDTTLSESSATSGELHTVIRDDATGSTVFMYDGQVNEARFNIICF